MRTFSCILVLLLANPLPIALADGTQEQEPVQFIDPHKQAAELRGKWNLLLKQKIAGCDTVKATKNWYRKDEMVVTTINEPQAVAELIAAIEVVEDWRGASVGCLGTYQYTFLRGGIPVATISEECGCLFWEDGPWVGTPPQTESSQKAVYEWTQKYLR